MTAQPASLRFGCRRRRRARPGGAEAGAAEQETAGRRRRRRRRRAAIAAEPQAAGNGGRYSSSASYSSSLSSAWAVANGSSSSTSSAFFSSDMRTAKAAPRGGPAPRTLLRLSLSGAARGAEGLRGRARELSRVAHAKRAVECGPLAPRIAREGCFGVGSMIMPPAPHGLAARPVGVADAADGKISPCWAEERPRARKGGGGFRRSARLGDEGTRGGRARGPRARRCAPKVALELGGRQPAGGRDARAERASLEIGHAARRRVAERV